MAVEDLLARDQRRRFFSTLNRAKVRNKMNITGVILVSGFEKMLLTVLFMNMLKVRMLL